MPQRPPHHETKYNNQYAGNYTAAYIDKNCLWGEQIRRINLHLLSHVV